jgi:protein phosphatase
MKAARPDISPAELEAIAPRNVVTRALGTKPEVEATVLVNSFQNGDQYLICSDGLWGVVSEVNLAAILATAGDLDSVCYALVDAALMAGGPDNVSALLVRVRR